MQSGHRSMATASQAEYISASKQLFTLDETGLTADKTPDRQRMTLCGRVTAGEVVKQQSFAYQDLTF